MLKRITKIGLPSAAEQLVLRVRLLAFTVTITSLGTKVFAAHQIVITILNLSFVNGQAWDAAYSLTGGARAERIWKQQRKLHQNARKSDLLFLQSWVFFCSSSGDGL